MEKAEELVGMLEAALVADTKRYGSVGTAEATARITRVVAQTLERYGFQARMEYPVRYGRRSGFLDVAGTDRGMGRIAVGIEIDRSGKPTSLAKLRAVAAAGGSSIWVRWGVMLPEVEDRPVPPPIYVVRLPLSLRWSARARWWSGAGAGRACLPRRW